MIKIIVPNRCVTREYSFVRVSFNPATIDRASERKSKGDKLSTLSLPLIHRAAELSAVATRENCFR